MPIVLYGNRHCNDVSIESRDILERDGFYPAAAAAFVGPRAFSEPMAKDRPDADDLNEFSINAAKSLCKQQIFLSCPPFPRKARPASQRRPQSTGPLRQTAPDGLYRPREPV